MIQYRLVVEPRAGADITGAFRWYQSQRTGLGVQFLAQLRAAYERILDGPLKYQDLRSGIRRALLRRFPYAVYFALDAEIIVVIAVLHVSRDPAEWRRRSGDG